MTKQPNTVGGHPEPFFRAAWVSLLWTVMWKTGRGYHRASLRRTGRDERRPDKVGTTKLQRRLMQRCQTA